MQITLLLLLPLILLSTVIGAPQSGGGDSRRLGPRYQVLMEYVLSGQKNVRYETHPMEYVDSKGNVMDAGKLFGKGCIGVEGKEHPNGEEYERPNGHFKYRCQNGQEEVTACVGSDRTNKALIKVGQTLDVNGYWHKCEKYPNGSVIYTQASSCTSGDKNYHVGEEMLLGNLRMLCGDQGYSVVGCYFYSNGQLQKLNAGEQKQIGPVTHVCEVHDNALQYYSKGVAGGCAKAGKEFKEGDVYSANHLRYKCQNGMMEVTGCYLDGDKDMAVGQDLVKKNMVHRCYKLGGKVEYTEYACGFSGTPSCKPEPIPQTSELPAALQGPISPGFGSFSIVELQKGGGQKVQHPSTVDLQLLKVPGVSQPMAAK